MNMHFPSRRVIGLRAGYWLWALSVVMTLGIYGPLLGGELLSDSFGYVALVHQWSTSGIATPLIEAWTRGSPTDVLAYRPLMHSLFAFEYAVMGPSSLSWRLVHLTLHASVAALLGILVHRLSRRDLAGLVSAMGATAIFLLRPTSVESAAWVADGSGLLAALFTLACAHTFLSARGRFDSWYAASLGAFALGLSSKEVAVTAPLLIAPLCLLRLDGSDGTLLRRFARLVPYGVLLILYLTLRWAIFGDPFTTDVSVPVPRWFEASWWASRLPTLQLWVAPPIPGDLLGARLVKIATGVALLVGAANILRGSSVQCAWLAGLAWWAALCILSLPRVEISEWGLGGRNFYLMGGALALCLAPAFTLTRIGVAVASALLLATGAYQLRIAEPWYTAAHDMRSFLNELPRVAATVPAGGYALVLAPDRIGGAYFVRNAQGPVSNPPLQQNRLSDRVVVSTYSDGPKWLFELARFGDDLSVWCWSSSGGVLRPVTDLSTDRDGRGDPAFLRTAAAAADCH